MELDAAVKIKQNASRSNNGNKAIRGRPPSDAVNSNAWKDVFGRVAAAISGLIIA